MREGAKGSALTAVSRKSRADDRLQSRQHDYSRQVSDKMLELICESLKVFRVQVEAYIRDLAENPVPATSNLHLKNSMEFAGQSTPQKRNLATTTLQTKTTEERRPYTMHQGRFSTSTNFRAQSQDAKQGLADSSLSVPQKSAEENSRPGVERNSRRSPLRKSSQKRERKLKRLILQHL